MSDAQAARLFGVSERSVENAKLLRRRAAPEIVNAVASGEMSLARAAAAVKVNQRRIAPGGRPASLPKLVDHKGRAIVLGVEAEHELPPQAADIIGALQLSQRMTPERAAAAVPADHVDRFVELAQRQRAWIAEFLQRLVLASTEVPGGSKPN
jgi:hypothetical protein